MWIDFKQVIKSSLLFWLDLFGPMFAPSILVGLLFLILLEIISKPSLLNPSLLIKALSLSSLNTLGFAFPNCFLGVMVPISINPNPNLKSEL